MDRMKLDYDIATECSEKIAKIAFKLRQSDSVLNIRLYEYSVTFDCFNMSYCISFYDMFTNSDTLLVEEYLRSLTRRHATLPWTDEDSDAKMILALIDEWKSSSIF
jgi:hypothetical protein